MANALQELVLRIGGDSSGGQQAVRDLSNALANTLSKALQDTGAKAEESGQKVSGFAKYLEDLKPSSDNAHAAFSDLRGTLTEMWQNPTAAVGKLASAIGTDLSGALGSAGGSLATLGVAAGGVVAVLGVAALAAFELAKRAAETGAKLDDLHDATGMSVEALSRLSNAAQVLGVDIKSLSDLVFKMQQRMGENPDEFAKGLERIGLDFEDFKRLKPEDQLSALSTALQKVTDYAERNAAGTALMGKGFRDLAPTLYDLNKALDLTKDITPWTAEQAAQAEQFDMQLKSITVHFHAIADALGRMAMPPVVAMLNLLLKWGESESTRMLLEVATILGPGAIGMPVPEFNAATIKPVASHGPTERPVGQIDGATDQEMFKLLEGLEKEQQEARLKRLEELKKARDDARKAEFEDEQKAQTEAYDLELHLHQQVMKLAEKQAEADKKIRDTALAARNKVVTDSVADIVRMQHLQEDANLSQADAQVRAIERRRDAEIQAVENILGLEGHLKDERIRLIKETTQAEIDNIDTVTNWWKGGVEHSMIPPILGVRQQVTTLGGSIDALATGFTQLATIGGDAFGSVARAVGATVVQLNTMVKTLNEANGAIAGVGKGGSAGGTASAFAGFASYADTALTVVTAMYSVYQVLAAAEQEAKKLRSIENWSKEVAAHFGTAARFSQQLAESIRYTQDHLILASGWFAGMSAKEKALFEALWKNAPAYAVGPQGTPIVSAADQKAFEKSAAEALHLTDVIRELGGLSALTADQLVQVQDRTRVLFLLMKEGGTTAATAVKELDNTLADMAAHLDRNGQVSQFFTDMVEQARVLGIVLPQVAEFFKGQAAAMATGLNDLLTQPLLTAGVALKKTVDDAQKALDDLKASGTATAKQITEAEQALTGALAAQHQQAVRNKQGLDDLGTIALTTFNAAIASGQDFVTALQSIGPQLDIIKHAYEDLGLTIDDAAVKGLTLENTILNGPGGTGKAVAGLHAVVTAGMNFGPGVETPGAFAAQQRTMASVYNQTQGATIAAGGTTVNALLPFQQTLQQMDDWAKKNHLELDANTQQMIDQSKELGIWNADFKTDSEKTRESIASLITSTDALAAALGGLPDALAAVIAGRPSYAAHGGLVTPAGVVQYLTAGGPVWTPHGTDRVAAMLTPGERVLSVAETQAYDALRLQQRLAAIIRQPSAPLFPGGASAFPGGTYGSSAPGGDVTKTYNVVITARDHDAAEQWRDWMRSDGVEVVVEELEDGRHVSRVNRALDR